jgi:hypothetical protein
MNRSNVNFVGKGCTINESNANFVGKVCTMNESNANFLDKLGMDFKKIVLT